MRKRYIPQYLTIAFLGLLFIAGSIQIFSLQERYGWTYEQTTIIKGETSTETVNLSSSAASLLFLLWIMLLLLTNNMCPEAKSLV